MAKNAIQYPVQIISDAKKDLMDGVQNLTNYELIGVAAVLGAAVVLTPHLLALNGAISLIGSCGRASGVPGSENKYVVGEKVAEFGEAMDSLE